MELNKKFVITINRELGSGGRVIGQKLAERLGVPFYDKALIKGLKEKFHLDVDEIEKLKGRNHSWWSDLKRIMNIGAGANINYLYNKDIEPDILTTDEMFKAEEEILKGISADESCIIAGRSGFYIFRNHPNHLSILFQASKDYRVAQVANKQNIPVEKALQIIEEVDQMRENYVNKYTKTSRYDTRNYDLVISVNGKTADEIIDIIMLYIGKKQS